MIKFTPNHTVIGTSVSFANNVVPVLLSHEVIKILSFSISNGGLMEDEIVDRLCDLPVRKVKEFVKVCYG